jgi:oxalate decarboxylase/phosphoglucose isomerase-like protein (cupin superfamily)
MQAFDSTLVPSGVVHRFINGGDQQLLILWIYGSISATRTLAATGETFQIGSSRERVTDASRTTTSNGRAGSRKRERQRLRSS